VRTRSLLAPLGDIARLAGEEILRVYRTDFEVRRKDDQSPVTDADLAAEAVILRQLPHLLPGVPIVSEEADDHGSRPVLPGRFWLVDPLDGTREFVRRNDEFTVNIGLIEDGRAVAGVIFAPALDRLFVGQTGLGAFEVLGTVMRSISCRRPPSGGISVITSRWNSGEASWKSLLAGHTIAGHETMGSSLKFAVVASGSVDAYPRHGRTHEWDTAAGQAILTAAGGKVADASGKELRYGKPGLVNAAFVATGWSDPEIRGIESARDG
jgi:3'(2'), 5'-bisphosphate nucleotidase